MNAPLALFLAAAAAGASSAEIVTRDDRPDSQYTAYAAQPQFACVGRLSNGFSDGCSGVVTGK